MAVWYIGSTKWTAVTAWAASVARSVGDLMRQVSPSAGAERVYVCTTAGTSKSGTAPTIGTTKGVKVTDGTAIWYECTGQPGVNGDVTNTPLWITVKNIQVKIGHIIKNSAETHYFICTTTGITGNGSEPSFNTTAGATTADNAAVWTCIGAVGNFAAWGAPFARIRSSETIDWGADGDKFYVSNNHAESQSTNLTGCLLGSKTAPSYYLCVNDSVAPPTALATTGSMIQSGSSLTTIGNTDSVNYVYGLNFIAGGNGLSLEGTSATYENCVMSLTTTTANRYIKLGISNREYFFNFFNCAFTLGAVSHIIQVGSSVGGVMNMVGGSVAATGTVPTVVFQLGITGTDGGSQFTLRDVNLSAITTSLFDVSNKSPSTVYLEDCRLGSGVSITTGSFYNQADSFIHIHNCDDSTKNYRFYTQNYMGTSQQETTTVRTGGASDGATPVSYKLISTANASYAFPFEAEEIAIWNEVIGVSMTATIEIAGAAALNTNDIWLEIEYLGSASYPKGSTITTKPGYLDTPTAIPTSTATWGGSPSSKQKLEVTITPQMRGIVKARVYLAKPGTTVYVDPYILLSNNVANRRQYLLPGYGYMNETAEGEYAYQFVG